MLFRKRADESGRFMRKEIQRCVDKQFNTQKGKSRARAQCGGHHG